MTDDKELMEIARKRVKDKAGFYVHFACYIMVNLSLFIFYRSIISENVNLIPILFGPLFGWGVGVVAHFISVFAGETEEKVQKEYKKLKEQQK
ncbi:MAG: 2TM domain-containing protein [Candidatus Thermoplasmatota archaeon]|nr:2TM domain-containing protein [Candidatus Thermoplasmatota archaeon]